MNKILFSVIVWFGLGLPVIAEHTRFTHEVLVHRNNEVVNHLIENQWRKLDLSEGLIEPNQEVDISILFLKNINEEDRRFIRFFTTYSIPPRLREQAVHALSFVIHSAVAVGDNSILSYQPLAIQRGDEFVPLRLVPGSGTMWWIDIRDYNWTVEAFEAVAQADGYFVEPIVDKTNNSFLVSLVGTPNVVLRADWFIRHVTDTQLQEDIGQEALYDILLYAQQKRPPNNINEWRELWTGIVNLDVSRALGNEYGTIVTNSEVVSRANRFLFGYTTESGYLYESYDVLFQQGKRNFVEGLLQFEGEPPAAGEFDAGEAFASNPLGMQVYTIYNGAGKLINEADAQAVRHLTDITGDARERTAFSCMDCHSSGPIPAENYLRLSLDAGIRIHIQNKSDAQRIDRTFLSDEFEKSIPRNQFHFAQALKQVNGLNPEDNGFGFLSLVKYYDGDVTLAKAAVECGVTEEQFLRGLSGRVTGRLALLVTHGTPIPRDVWESPGFDGIPGEFQQAMFVLHGEHYVEQQDFNDFIDKDADIVNQGPSQDIDVVKTKTKRVSYVVILRRDKISRWEHGILVDVGYLPIGVSFVTNGEIVWYGDAQWIAISTNRGWVWARLSAVSDIRVKNE